MSYFLCVDQSCGKLAGESGYCETHGAKAQRSVFTELASLREKVRTLTEDKAALARVAAAYQRDTDALRARVAELEAHRAQLASERNEFAAQLIASEAERDAAQQRAKTARATLLRELAAEQREAANLCRETLPERAAHHDATADGYEAQATKEEAP